MLMEITFLADITVIFLTAAIALAICSKLNVPEILGYLITGVLLGPHGLGIIHAVHEIEMMAEMGVVMLLFAVGLEFSLSSLVSLKIPALVGGSLQMLLTVAAGGAAVYFISDGNLPLAVAAGMIVSLSSTAIVLKVLGGRGETDSPHGRISTAILVFQDIAVIPMMLMIPVMAGAENSGAGGMWSTALKAVLIVAAVFVGARTVVPKLLYHVAASRNRELFMLVVILAGLGTASLTYKAGLSLALGAFLAGIMVSESGYGQQALSSVVPFKDIFTGFFFVSIGMLIDFNIYAQYPVAIPVTAIVILFGKTLITSASVMALRYPVRTAIMTGLALGQVGEFSFIMAQTGVSAGILSEEFYKFAVAVIVLTMAAAPYMIKYAPFLAELTAKIPMPIKWRDGAQAVFTSVEKEFKDHIIIVGYGFAGRQIAANARKTGVDFIAIEMNPSTVKNETKKGTDIIYGDASNVEVLHHAHLETARTIAVTVPDPVAVRKIVESARREHPYIHIIARTRYALELSPLKKLGADTVIAEEVESAQTMVTEVMGGFDAAGKETGSNVNLPGAATRWMTVPVGSKSSGKSLRGLDLRYRYGVTVIAVRRGGKTMPNPMCDFTIMDLDELLVIGTEKDITRLGVLLKPSKKIIET